MKKNKNEKAEIVYNQIANKYKQSKLLPFRIYVEKYTFFQLLGELKNKSVLDLACGEGIYTREIKKKGATIVYGVDISPKMIELAETEEKKNPLDIKYKVADVAEMKKIEEFDIVCATYLLNYANTKDKLRAFAKAIYSNLKSGGKFVCINDNINQHPDFYSLSRKYGFIKSASSVDQKEGDEITYTFLDENGNQDFSFNNYYLHSATYETIFKEIGFASFKWIMPQLSLEIDEKDKSFWNDFLQHPPIIGIEACK